MKISDFHNHIYPEKIARYANDAHFVNDVASLEFSEANIASLRQSRNIIMRKHSIISP